MNVICVDDETLVLQLTEALCREILPEGSVVKGFLQAAKALAWVDKHRVDAALLDIDMPGMNGLALAARIKQLSPDTPIIFVMGYAQYAVDAFSMHTSGYLMKPLSKERLLTEISYATHTQVSDGKIVDPASGQVQGPDGHAQASGAAEAGQAPKPPHIQAQTFGNFELFVDGETVYFARSKSKELLAYLVDRQGSGIMRAEAAAVLWEDSLYDRSMQKQLDVVIRSLRSTLDEHGIGELMEIQRGFLRIRQDLLDCDLYRFMNGDIDAVNSYRGEYMNSYYWAELTEGYIEQKAQAFRFGRR